MALLTGFASLPAATFAPGPPSGADNGSGEPISANGFTGPFESQPVQGFSGVQFPLEGEGDEFYFLSDNGFGSQANSTDYLLRIYEIDPDFVGFEDGDGSVEVGDFIQLADPNNLIPFEIQNEDTTDRLLTGADFDIESFVIGNDGTFWIGDEFGPFILHFDSDGTLIEAPISTPDIVEIEGEIQLDGLVQSPQNPFLEDPDLANIGGSDGFEGLGFSPDRSLLYPVLEGTVAGDPEGSVRIYEFEVESSSFTDFIGFYQFDDPINAIGDITPINDDQFLIIERDNLQGDEAEFKQIFLIDITEIDENGFVSKEPLVDLLNIDDPNDLDGNGEDIFTFPFVTIEDVLVIDEETILVANDNNFPFSTGRDPVLPDNNEIILLQLEEPLDLDPNLGAQAIGIDEAELIFGSPEDDVLESGIDFDELNNIIFTGEGEDLIDTFTVDTSDNRVYSGSDNDEFIVGSNDRIFGGEGDDILDASDGDGDNRLYGDEGDDEILVNFDDRGFGGVGNDTLDASEGSGGNRLYGGEGDDTFILGEDDRIVGGEGDDTILVTDEGDNLITGGEGADTFLVTSGDILDSPNTITDFDILEDIISVGGVGEAPSLDFSAVDGSTNLTVEGNLVAIFLGVDIDATSANIVIA